MLSSSGLREDAARCRQLGFASYLTKPVRQSALLDAITAALGKPRPPSRTPSVRLMPRSSDRSLRILLAEDNPVNQTLAVRLLEKRGHRVTLVGTGREAVAAVAREPFDVVLMDVQMPEMDGFEATKLIREREGRGARIPIIAMTALALKGDRERCLAAGMDDYVSKPLTPDVLFRALEQLGGDDRPVVPPAAPPGAPGPRPLDAARALKRAGGDPHLLADMATICLEECPQLMTDIRAALGRKDAAGVKFAAHTLKGSVGPFEAIAARDAAERLEDMGRRQDLTDAEAAWAELSAVIERLIPALTELQAGSSAPPPVATRRRADSRP